MVVPVCPRPWLRSVRPEAVCPSTQGAVLRYLSQFSSSSWLISANRLIGTHPPTQKKRGSTALSRQSTCNTFAFGKLLASFQKQLVILPSYNTKSAFK